MDLWENENDEDHAMYLGEMSVWTQEYNDSIIKKIEEMERDELNLEHYAALRDNAKLKKYIKSHCSEKYNAKDIMKGITAAEDKKIKRTSLEKGNPETPRGIRKRFKTADWRTTDRPDTPQLLSNRVYKSQRTAQELRSTLFDESKPKTTIPYSREERPNTPPRRQTPRKTKTTRGGGGKNKRTIRNKCKVL